MAEYITRNVLMAISKQRETTLNQPYTSAADFVGALSTEFSLGMPQIEFRDDLGKIGLGNEFATQLDADYWSHTQMRISDEVNTETCALLLARALGGTVTDTAITTTQSYDHDIQMQTDAQGRILPPTSVVAKVGGYDFLLSSMIVQSFTLSQQGAARPTFAAELVGTGYYKRLSEITPPLTIPAPATHHYMHGAATLLTFSDGTTVNLSQQGRLRSLSIQLNNNLMMNDRRPGDPFLDPTDRRSGAYVRVLNRGVRTVTAQIEVMLDENLGEFLYHKNNTDLTQFRVVCRGMKIGATPDSYEVELTMARARYRAVQPMAQGDDLMLRIEIQPLASGGQLLTARVRNDQATLQ